MEEEESVKYVTRTREANFGILMKEFCAKNEERKEKNVGVGSSPSNIPSSITECEGLINKLVSQITVPSSGSSSPSNSSIITSSGRSKKEDNESEKKGEGEDLMMSQESVSRSLLVTVIELYQKFGKISSQDISFPNSN